MTVQNLFEHTKGAVHCTLHTMCDGDSMHRPNLIPYIAYFKLILSTTAIYVSVDYISLWGRCHTLVEISFLNLTVSKQLQGGNVSL